ncbi:DUF2303 family protein [Microbacterium esteraromaticum]|uniref:DUF2303 family protein n=1 Tax=Microbacterium esteraromaticum TaxID=57043 RepID=UPI002368240B|nr:DUF2303 family protein [Microbacterium esteraromaticum]WDH77885.1 DUF2303 family protein [Microbacterium esteraromaticum]
MTTIEDTKTEAAVVANLQRQADGEAHEPIHAGEIYLVPDGDGSLEIVDTDEWADTPRRITANRVVTDAASFASYVNRHKTDGTEVFAHTNSASIVAVIDSHEGTNRDGGWQKHRLTLSLEHSKPWLAWSRADGNWFDQDEFAEFLENRYSEVIDPDPARMIDIATTFEAKKGVDFKSGIRTDSGEVKLQFEETVKAKAGQKGELEIPKKIQLALRPYVGGPIYSIWANFRYRITASGLRLGFILERPENILDAAFADVVTDVVNGREDSDTLPGFQGIADTPLFYGKP